MGSYVRLWRLRMFIIIVYCFKKILITFVSWYVFVYWSDNNGYNDKTSCYWRFLWNQRICLTSIWAGKDSTRISGWIKSAWPLLTPCQRLASTMLYNRWVMLIKDTRKPIRRRGVDSSRVSFRRNTALTAFFSTGRRRGVDSSRVSFRQLTRRRIRLLHYVNMSITFPT